MTTNAEGVIEVNDLVVGSYYLVEIETPDLVDGMITPVLDNTARDNVGEYLAGHDALNNANNALGFVVGADGQIIADEGLEGYTNYMRPSITKELTNGTAITQNVDGAEVERTAFGIGEDMTFEIDLVVPQNVENYRTFEFTDSLLLDGTSNGHVAYVGTPVLTAGETTLVDGVDYTYTVAEDGQSFTVNFIMNGAVTETVAAATSINMAYGANFTNTPDLSVLGNYTNEVVLTYNNTPTGLNNPTADRFDRDEEEYTPVSVSVRKVDDGLFTTGALADGLAGAEFVVRNEAGLFFQGFDADVMFGDRADAEVFTSDESGLITITGLTPGEYTMVEVKAPEGFRLPVGTDAETAITVSGDINTIIEIENQREGGFVVTGSEQVIVVVLAVVSFIAIGVLVLRKKEKTA